MLAVVGCATGGAASSLPDPLVAAGASASVPVCPTGSDLCPHRDSPTGLPTVATKGSLLLQTDAIPLPLEGISVACVPSWSLQETILGSIAGCAFSASLACKAVSSLTNKRSTPDEARYPIAIVWRSRLLWLQAECALSHRIGISEAGRGGWFRTVLPLWVRAK